MSETIASPSFQRLKRLFIILLLLLCGAIYISSKVLQRSQLFPGIDDGYQELADVKRRLSKSYNTQNNTWLPPVERRDKPRQSNHTLKLKLDNEGSTRGYLLVTNYEQQLMNI